nr:hypothetical protein [Tanacetum cinerariifolium]
MVAILEKSEHNIDFHLMVDFIKASPLRYALTVKPTVYVSYIRQFWSTARIETTEEGTQILATVDGIHRTVTESSLRRNLKLQDEEGISSLPDTKLFENLTLMGYNISPNQKFTFQKGQFSHQWMHLIHTIMQSLSPKSIGFNEFSSNIATALVCLATNRTYNFSKMIFDGLVKNVNNKVSKFLMYPRFLTMFLRMIQFGQITYIHTYVVNFHTKKLFTTLRVNSPSFSGRIVPLFESMLVQQGKGSSTPTESHHTPSPVALPPSPTTHSSLTLPPVTTTSIPADRATIAKSSTLPHDSAPRVTSPAADEGSMQQTISEFTALRTSLQRQRSELLAKFQAQKGRSLDEGEAAAERISDDSKEMATVLTSMDAATVLTGGITNVPTGSGSIPTASPLADKVPTGSVVVPTASLVFATAIVVTPYRRRKGKKVMVEIELISDLVKYQDNYAKVHKFQSQQRNPWTKKQKRDYYMAVIRSNLGWKVKDFRGMTFEEVEAKFNSVWKQLEEFIPIEEVTEEAKSSDEVPEEKVYHEGQRSYWKITRLGGSLASYQFFIDLLKYLDREDLNKLWRLVKETLSNRPPTIEWKLYDSCGVHHVTSKDKEIFMLVEKDYPLRKGLALVMINYKLQLEHQVYGRIVGNKMHKAFPLPVIEFPLAEELPTASEESCHCQKKSEPTAVKIALLSKVKKKLSVKVK